MVDDGWRTATRWEYKRGDPILTNGNNRNKITDAIDVDIDIDAASNPCRA